VRLPLYKIRVSVMYGTLYPLAVVGSFHKCRDGKCLKVPPATALPMAPPVIHIQRSSCRSYFDQVSAAYTTTGIVNGALPLHIASASIAVAIIAAHLSVRDPGRHDRSTCRSRVKINLKKEEKISWPETCIWQPRCDRKNALTTSEKPSKNTCANRNPPVKTPLLP
jgi:hypothetical protein